MKNKNECKDRNENKNASKTRSENKNANKVKSENKNVSKTRSENQNASKTKSENKNASKVKRENKNECKDRSENKNENAEIYINSVLEVIIILAIMARLIYALVVPYTMFQHDVYTVEYDGHLGYIYTIFKTGTLPTTNQNQFYHPPLHHTICAIWMRIVSLFTSDIDVLCNSLKILTCAYSIILLFVILKILKELGFDKKIQAKIMGICAFQPTLIVLAGSINNDMLSLLLMMTSILYLIRWYKKSDYQNTILLAIFTGAAVMTKMNSAMLAPIEITVFLAKLICEVNEKSRAAEAKGKIKAVLKNYVPKFSVFAVIALPLALWYPIRNYILFNQPLLYVPAISTEAQYYGQYSLLERVFSINFKTLMMAYHNVTNLAYNLYAEVVKSALFGEWSLATDGVMLVVAKIAVLFSAIASIFVTANVIKNIVVIIKTRNREIIYKLIFVELFVFNAVSEMVMVSKLPYGCSSDFRYLIPTLFSSAILLGYNLKEKKSVAVTKMIYAYIGISLLAANLVWLYFFV